MAKTPKVWYVNSHTRGPDFRKNHVNAGVYLVQAKDQKTAIQLVRQALKPSCHIDCAVQTKDFEVPEKGRVYKLSDEEIHLRWEAKKPLSLNEAQYVRFPA